MEFGSRAGSWTAMVFFTLLFASLGWAAARAIRRRSSSDKQSIARVVGGVLFAGPPALLYLTSLGGFYTASLDSSRIRLQYLLPFVTRDLPLSDVLSVTARPWYRGRWRLAIVTNDEARYESATSARGAVDGAVTAIGTRLGASPSTSHGDQAVQDQPLELTYVANEGVLIESAGRRILIDGLHREYEPEYPFLPPAEQERIETAQPPFGGIELLLVSHIHRDHFHPDAVARHLRHNSGAVLLSSPQVVDETTKSSFAGEDMALRLQPVWPDWGRMAAREIAGIRIELLGLRHGTGRHASIQNLGHLITVGGRTLLHVGDADATAENFEVFNLAARRIDVAFLPSWHLLEPEGRAVVRRHIKPRQIVAVHMPARGAAEPGRRIRESFPNATVFSTLLQRVRVD